MIKDCGDDLVAARRFMNLCQNHMQDMFGGNDLPAAEVLEKLGEIQSAAKLNHARAIYRAAQIVVEDVNERREDHICARSVLSLQHIIRQYRSGLDEVAPLEIETPAVIEAEAASEINDTPEAGDSLLGDMTRQKRAVDTLKPLVALADEEDQQGLLKLISMAANDAPVKKSAASEKFDVIMPGLTNDWLRLARRHDKSVSVSFGADGTRLDNDVLKALKQGLRSLGEQLIQRTIETPENRRVKGLSQTAHIALTSRVKKQHLEVLISCDGSLPEDLKFSGHLAALGASLSVYESNGIIRVELSQIPLQGSGIADLMEAAS